MIRQSNDNSLFSNRSGTALYTRLSRDDENEGDSNSIAHQVEILTRYATDHGFTNIRVYKDDGFSGANFNRPGFQQMLTDIESGLVSTVIVKDMSRFGRNYLEVGMYTEIRFPEKGVRFIAVNNGIDSAKQSDGDFTPFLNIMNEWLCRDTSKKIRAVLRSKGLSGKRVSTQIPYGYLKGADGTLVPDEETAPIVQWIYRLAAEGNGTGKIARILREQEILTPRALKYSRTGQYQHTYDPDHPYHWSENTIALILSQKEYLGHTVNFKTTRISYKSKKSVANPEDKQFLIEHTHPAIIDDDLWALVQKLRQHRQRPTRLGEPGLFSGVLYCADCGHRLHLSRSASPGKYSTRYLCGNYNRKREVCSAHYIRESVLEDLVLENLRGVISYARNYEADFAQIIAKNSRTAQELQLADAKKQLLQNSRRIIELDTIIKRLYEDNVMGKISDERFAKLSSGYEQEQRELSATLAGLQDLVSQAGTQRDNISKFMRLVRQYTAPEVLTPGLVREFIDKIIVHAPDKSNGRRTQQIDIYYSFIGKVDI